MDSDWTLEELVSSGKSTLMACPGTIIEISLDEIYEDCELDDAPDLTVSEFQEVYTW